MSLPQFEPPIDLSRVYQVNAANLDVALSMNTREDQ